MTSFSVINVVAYKPLRGIEKKYVSEFMNQGTKLKCPHERREDGSLESNGMGSPEMEKIELRITCIGSKMIGYKFLHGFLSSLFPFKINSL
jgi:hypothetical protein